MTAHILVMLSLASPSDIEGAAFNSATLAAVPWSGPELRAACRLAVIRTLRPETFRPERDVPELVLLRAALGHTQAVSRSERIQSIRRIDYSLEKSLAYLERQHARLKKPRSSSATVAGSRADLNGGAAEARQAQQLISLIEATIQPETWATNGGLGVMQYWPPGYALVVRNSQAVHAEIRGLIGQLEASPR